MKKVENQPILKENEKEIEKDRINLDKKRKNLDQIESEKIDLHKKLKIDQIRFENGNNLIEENENEEDISKYKKKICKNKKKKKKEMKKNTIESIKLYNGIGIPRNQKKAIEKCLESWEKKDKLAEALVHYYGWETDTNHQRSLEILERIVQKEKFIEKKPKKSISLILSIWLE